MKLITMRAIVVILGVGNRARGAKPDEETPSRPMWTQQRAPSMCLKAIPYGLRMALGPMPKSLGA